MTEKQKLARHALDVAVASRDIDRAADAAARLVRQLIDDGRDLVAANELEQAIGWLTHQPSSARVLPPMLFMLGALYDDLGDPDRARRARNSAHAYASIAPLASAR